MEKYSIFYSLNINCVSYLVLQLIIEANEGWQNIALDNISLKSGACGKMNCRLFTNNDC